MRMRFLACVVRFLGTARRTQSRSLGGARNGMRLSDPVKRDQRPSADGCANVAIAPAWA